MANLLVRHVNQIRSPSGIHPRVTLSETWYKTLDDLFVHTLQDIYYAENQITKALPKMIEKATDPQLKQGFQTHLAETQNQMKRLEQVFEMHGQKPKASIAPRLTG